MKLVVSPNPILSQVATSWDFNTDTNANDLEVDMVQLMVESNGIGLAANQVGILKRVFAIHLTDQVPFCMFNPAVISSSNTIVDNEEGCLSFPDLWLKVKRPSSITAEYFDRQGKQCIIELSGIDARCFLHELDHLNGEVFINKVSTLKLAMAKKKQQKRKHNG